MSAILISICGLYILLAFWQLIVLFRYNDDPGPEPTILPEITVLVAARNEEDNIGACLEALCALDYPKEKLHIIVGNDQSVDATLEIAQEAAKKNPNITVVNIVDDDSGLKAKARVMAQMDKLAKGDFYLVTDADVRVKPGWAKWLIRHMKPETGVASGTTMVEGKDLNSHLQGMDWAYFMGLLNIISYSGVPATAVGNNMIIRSDAYWQTGGYAAIRFSITEDYRLYKEVCSLGWKWNNIMIPEVLAYSKPIQGFRELLHQRKRWLSGGLELPWYWWLLFGVFGLYYFAIPVLLVMQPLSGLLITAVKFTVQLVQLNRIYTLLGEKPPGILKHMAYEIYLFVLTICTAIFFLLPFKTIWKDRKY